MKTFLFAFMMLANNCFSQSILEHLEIESIQKIEISYSPIMDDNPKEGKIVKSSTDSTFIHEIEMMLGKLPAAGTCFKDFGQHIPTYRIKILDKKNNTYRLTFFGTKLRAQINGSFYCGRNPLFKFEKELYAFVSNFIQKD